MRVLVGLALWLLAASAWGGTGAPGNERALAGVSRASFVVDVNVGDPEKLVLRLELLERTHRQLREAGVEPRVVAAFRGPASRFVTVGTQYVKAADIRYKAQVREWVERLHGMGVVLEQCAIAAELLEIDPADVLPQVTVVANGYVSLIGYQTQGYAFLPMD